MKLSIIGAGYVGLTCGACLAEIGHTVLCVDTDDDRIARLNENDLPIYENGLAELLARNRRANRVAYTANMPSAVRTSDAVILAVGTPSGPDGHVDLSMIEAAARDIAPHLSPDAVVIVKSTVVAGTARRLRELISRERGGRAVEVASNPEFLREGSAVADFMDADRIVIGADDERTLAKMRRLYQPLRRRGVPVIETTTINAELIKYAANAFLAMKIGFINDVADLCEAVRGDVSAVSKGIGLDSRIGPTFLKPGPGYGGSCFPKDTLAFAALGREVNAPQRLVETLTVQNELRKKKLAKRAVDRLGAAQYGDRVAVLGAAFKAGTDDMRGSVALTLVPLLMDAGYRVSIYDPQANRNAAELLPDGDFHDCPYAACKGVEAAFVITDWDAFRSLDIGRLVSVMRGRTIFDFRNLYEPSAFKRHDVDYISIGRAPALGQRRKAAAEAGSGISVSEHV